MPWRDWTWVGFWSAIILGGLLMGTFRRRRGQPGIVGDILFTGLIAAPVMILGFLYLSYLALVPLSWLGHLNLVDLWLPPVLALASVYAWGAGRTTVERVTMPVLFALSGLLLGTDAHASIEVYRWIAGGMWAVGIAVSVIPPLDAGLGADRVRA